MISEEHKRGLRLLKTIFDLKGQKRFKQREGKAENLGADFEVGKLNADEAKKIFRKLTNTTTYERNLGQRP